MKDFINKNTKSILIIFIAIIVSVIGITLAYNSSDIGVNIATGNYNVVYTGTSTLPESKLEPIVDSDLLLNSSTDKIIKINFSVKGANTNPKNKDIIYDVSLSNLTMPRELRSEYLKWRLYQNSTQLSEGNFSPEFDMIINRRMVFTNIQQDLPSYSETPDKYTLYIWISESCTGDITTCTEDMDQSALTGKSISGEVRIELSTGSKKELVRVTGTKEDATDLGDVPDTTSALATLTNLGLTEYIKEGTPDFSEVPETDEGIYATTDDLGTSYYFRGASEHNYVKFGKYPEGSSYYTGANGMTEQKVSGFTLEECENSDYEEWGSAWDVSNCSEIELSEADMYWRIIRINGDGSIRMIYDGTSPHQNGEVSEDRIFGYYYDNDYSGLGGLEYGTVESSGANYGVSYIKSYIERWYSSYILNSEYNQYVTDAIYCNDKSGEVLEYRYIFNTQKRIDSFLPSLKCERTDDKFTVASGMSTAPVGLITTDEAIYAGIGTNSEILETTNYLYNGIEFWTMSPDYDSETFIYNYTIDSYIKSASTGEMQDSRGVRPVITIKGDLNFIGDGSDTDPFVIE